MSRLLLFFLITPVVELALLLRVGDWIGFGPTVALIIVTAIAGSYLARREGLSVWRQLNQRLGTGQLPGTELVDGVIILLSGALLITPGIITDFVGFAGLLPPSRALIRRFVTKRMKAHVASGKMNVHVHSFGNGAGFDTSPFEPSASEPDQQGEATWGGQSQEVPGYVKQRSEPRSGSEEG